MRLIDADALKEEFTCKGDEWINNIIDNEPTIDRPRGKWHHIQSVCYGGGTMNEVVCSKCHEHQILPTNFCPYCGADMRGVDDE